MDGVSIPTVPIAMDHSIDEARVSSFYSYNLISSLFFGNSYSNTLQCVATQTSRSSFFWSYIVSMQVVQKCTKMQDNLSSMSRHIDRDKLQIKSLKLPIKESWW